MKNIDCPHCDAKPMATGNLQTVFVYWQCGTPIRGQQGKTCRILQLEGEVERLEAIVEHLETTKDDKPILDGQKLYKLDWQGKPYPVRVQCKLTATDRPWVIAGTVDDDIDPTECYSTTAAAKAAKDN